MSSIKRRFIDNILLNISNSSFTPHLGIFPSELISHQNNITTFKYKISPYLCYKDEINGPYLTTSATIALFDEFSSFATILNDKNNRSGVSIILTAENYSNILPNSEVVIVSKSLKVGKTIGFSELQMFDINQNLVASGSHIKFLDMGKLWNFFMQPSIFPLIVNLLDSSIIKTLLFFGGIYHTKPKPICDINEIGSIYSLFKFQEVDSNRYNLTVPPYLMNPNQTFHGGAVAMSIEQSAILSNLGIILLLLLSFLSFLI